VPPPRLGRSVGLGRKIGPRSAHSWDECGPTGGDRSWPSDLIRRPAASLAGSKPGRRPPPRNPRTFSLPPLSPYHETAAAAMVAAEEMTRRRRRGLLAGARARRWVSAPPSSSPLTAPRFGARSRAPRRLGGERRPCSWPHPGERRRRTFPRDGSRR